MSSPEFCFATHPLLRRLISERKVGCLDDVTLSGPRQIVVDDIKTILSKSEELGLELNAAKCEVTYGDSSTPHDDPILKIFQRTKMDDLTLLGAPILSGRAVDKALKEKTEKLKKAISRLYFLQSHDALNLLRNSISVTNYFTRFEHQSAATILNF